MKKEAEIKAYSVYLATYSHRISNLEHWVKVRLCKIESHVSQETENPCETKIDKHEGSSTAERTIVIDQVLFPRK